MPDFVTRAELAVFLKMPPTSDEATSELFQEVLTSALENVRDKVGPLDSAEETFVVYPSHTAQALLPRHLVSIGAVTDPDGVLVPAADVSVNLRAGIVTLPVRGPGPWTVKATTRATKASLKQAVKIIAGHLYETQRGRAGGGARPGAFTPSGDGDAVRMGFAIPSRAAELLAPFADLGI